MAKERPILFSTPMVKAILAGNKTQTRRIVKYPKQYQLNELIGWKVKPHADSPSLFSFWYDTKYTLPAFRCPYGQIKDVLWVRETWVKLDSEFVYRASVPDFIDVIDEDGCFEMVTSDDIKWKSSIFMPKEACRIRLEILDVNVERLCDITEHDALCEGVEQKPSMYPSDVYAELWDTINGTGAWIKNPYVWVITFKKL